MDNIILIGMPGSGKSTVGVLLAKIIGYRFIDTDLLIQEKEGRKLFEILRDSGNDYFAAVENEVNSSVMADKTVIATGGSAIYGEDAMKHLGSIGKIVFLDVPLYELEKRINNLSTRGIMFKSGQTLNDIYSERLPLYRKWADITISCEGESLSENAMKIAEALGL
ncbi:MAG: shikimate kinase [Ruminococcaceae bacterium]|nr:shikimate kinase [Oscillospiraceae bacterium]